MELKVKIDGLDKLKNAFNLYPLESAKNIQRGIVQSITKIERESVPITPIDTSRLRESIPLGKKIKPLTGEIGPTVDYGYWVHEGTTNWPLSMPPKNPNTVRQFMRVGLEMSELAIQGFFNKAIENTLNNITR